MANKPDIVSLMWVVGPMNRQAEEAEKALVAYSNDLSRKEPLLQCMWAVHQITSTLRALGMKKGEMLTLEMERALNFLYKDKLPAERCKLTLGGLMQALKVLPAYLAHTQSERHDTGQGLEQYVNDLRRWLGERPRPRAYFFNMDFPRDCGITPGASPAPDEEIINSANVMLVLYLEMVKKALRRDNVREGMKTVARVSRRMQLLFSGTEAERFWFTLVGICEGVAGGLIAPDECVAQIFKSGAFMIKYARENGAELDPDVDYNDLQQQMLYYIAACKSRPVHITRIREVFAIDEYTLEEATRGLVHMDALVTALSGAMEQLNNVVGYLNSHDLLQAAQLGDGDYESFALEGLEAAEYRLEAAGQVGHADSLRAVNAQMKKLYEGGYRNNPARLEQAVDEVIRGIIDVKLDIEHKLEHGLGSSFSSREYELRESVVTSTFNHMALVENHLHHILRRKSLASALARKPFDAESLTRLTQALNRYLNKSDQGHEELREAVREADKGRPDLDLLYGLAREFLDETEDTPDRKAIEQSLGLLDGIAGALNFAGLEREGRVIEKCHQWLAAASKAGDVREDDAFRCFADAFAQIELHLQRSLIDPLDDTSHMIALAEQRAAELENFARELSAGADVATSADAGASDFVQDAEVPPEVREVFIDECDDIVAELGRLTEVWLQDPQANDVLRDIRRHFHTFKGNGRAVGANILGELGWAAQDMLDHVLDGDLTPDDRLMKLLEEVVAALPDLVLSYQGEEGLDVDHTRELTNRCFALANASDEELADTMPPADESPQRSIRLVSSTPASEPASQ